MGDSSRSDTYGFQIRCLVSGIGPESSPAQQQARTSHWTGREVNSRSTIRNEVHGGRGPPVTASISGPLAGARFRCAHPLIVRRMLRHWPERFRASRSTYQANGADCDSQRVSRLIRRTLACTMIDYFGAWKDRGAGSQRTCWVPKGKEWVPFQAQGRLKTGPQVPPKSECLRLPTFRATVRKNGRREMISNAVTNLVLIRENSDTIPFYFGNILRFFWGTHSLVSRSIACSSTESSVS